MIEWREAECFGRVKSLSLRLPSKQIYGITGERDGDRSCFLALLSGALTLQKGEIFVDGFSLSSEAARAKRRIGYSALPIHDSLRVSEHLIFSGIARTKNEEGILRKIPEWLETVDLTDQRDTLASRLNAFERARLSLALSLSGDPENLLLDDPSRKLTSNESRQIADMIKALSEDHTVFVASPDLAFLQSISDRILIFSDGILQKEGDDA